MVSTNPEASRATREPRDLDDELRAHLELAQDFHRSRGLDPAEAERLARERLGDPGRIREAVHRVYAPRWIDLIRTGGRATITAAAVALLVANLAVVWALHGRAPRTVADGQPWMTVWSQPDERAQPSTLSTYEVFRRLGQHVDVFSAVSASRYETQLVSGAFPAEAVRLKYVSAEAPSQLGWPIVAGRGFTVGEEGTPVALLTDERWERWFGRAPAAVGSEITIGGEPHRVIGVVGRSVDFFYPSGLVVPLDRDEERGVGARLLVTARLRDGIRRSADPSIDLEGIDGRAVFSSSTLTFTPLSFTFARPFASEAWRLVTVFALLALSAVSFVWPTRRHPDDRTRGPRPGVWTLLLAGAAGIAAAPVLTPWVGEAIAGATAPVFSMVVDAPVVFAAVVLMALLVGLLGAVRALLAVRTRGLLGVAVQLAALALLLADAGYPGGGDVIWTVATTMCAVLLFEATLSCRRIWLLSRPLGSGSESIGLAAPRPR